MAHINTDTVHLKPKVQKFESSVGGVYFETNSERAKGPKQCDQCEYKTDKTSNLKRHVHKQHEKEEYLKRTQCDLCD